MTFIRSYIVTIKCYNVLPETPTKGAQAVGAARLSGQTLTCNSSEASPRPPSAGWSGACFAAQGSRRLPRRACKIMSVASK